MQDNLFVIDLSSPNLQNRSQIVKTTTQIAASNISFHSVSTKNPPRNQELLTSSNLFPGKWVLNKLIEMECERIEEIKVMLPKIQENKQTKEELLDLCLDMATNKPDFSWNQEKEEEDKSFLERLFEDPKELIFGKVFSFQSVILEKKVALEENERMVRSLDWGHKGEKKQDWGGENNNSVVFSKAVEEKDKNCEMIVFSETSIVEQLKQSQKIKKRDSKRENSNKKVPIFQAQKIKEEEKQSFQIRNSQVLIQIGQDGGETIVSGGIFNHKQEKQKKKGRHSFSSNPEMNRNSNFSTNNPKIRGFTTDLALKSELESNSPINKDSRSHPVFFDHPNDNEEQKQQNIKLFSAPKINKTTPVKVSNILPLMLPPNLNNPELGLISCEICLDVLPKSRQLKAGKCPDVFCSSCLQTHLIESIKAGKVLQIPCPKSGCPHKYTDAEIAAVLKEDHPDMLQKYHKFKRQISLSKDPNIRWCIRPDCDNYMRGDASSTKLVCACGEEICYNCSRKWHEGRSCIQLMDLEYEDYRKRMNLIDCPKCKSHIEKISGCNHMTCTRCRYEFCWVCGKKYTKRHFRKLNIFGCPGMLYSTVQRDKNLKRKICREKVLTLFKIIAAVLLFFLLPLFGLLFLIGIPNICYFQNHRARFNCSTVSMFFVLSIIGIVLSPVFLVLAIVPGTCLLICSKKLLFRPPRRNHRRLRYPH